MNQINSITTKEKFKHLSNESIREIIREYNEFMTTVRVSFRSTHKNHHLKIPKRNINKTTFLKRLAVYHNTSLSNIYNIIRSSTTRIKDSLLNEKIIYDSQIAIIKRQNNKKGSNHSKLTKASKFIKLVVDEVKSSKLKSIDEVINDLKINRKSEIEGMPTICTSTMYTYVKKNYLAIKPIDLPRMLRRKTKNYKRYILKRQRGTSIDERPEFINNRSEFGHWEGDLVTGPRDGQNGAFLTLAERQTRFYYMIPIKNKKSKTIYMAINKLAKKLGPHFKEIFKSITFDNGAEFSRYKSIEKRYNIKIYFAHPYASYERGTNEITNQLIRYFIPKGTDINTVDKYLIKEIQLGINNKKRKILGYQPSEFFFKKQIDLISNNTIFDFYL